MAKKNIIGNQLRRIRTNLDLSQEQLAIRLQLLGHDVDRSHISKLEGQSIHANDVELIYLAAALKTTIAALFPAPRKGEKAIDLDHRERKISPKSGIESMGRFQSQRRPHGRQRKRATGGFPWLVSSLLLPMLLLISCHRIEEQTELVVYAAGPRQLADTICNQFAERSGSKVRLFSATTGEIMAKLQAETHRPQADVIIVASQAAAEVLKESGVLAPLPSLDHLATRSQWNTHYYAGTSGCALGIATRADYEGNLLWTDLFEGKLKGSLIMPSPSQSGTSGEFVVMFHQAEGDTFWNGLKMARQQGLQVSGPNSQALTSLMMGSQDVIVGAADYLVFRQIEKGEALRMHFPPSGVPVIPRPVAIIAKSKNRQQAEEFVKFCFSKEIQEAVAKAHLIPADASIPLSAERQAAGTVNPLPLDVERATHDQRQVLRKFRYEIERGAAL